MGKRKYCWRGWLKDEEDDKPGNKGNYFFYASETGRVL